MSSAEERKSHVGLFENYELYVLISIVLTNLVLIVVIRETLMRKLGLMSLKGIDRIVLTYIIILSVNALELILNILVCASPYLTQPIWAGNLFYRLQLLLMSFLESIFLYYGFVMRNVEIKMLIGILELHVIIAKLRNQIYLTWTVFLSYVVVKFLDVLIYALSINENLRDSVGLSALTYFQSGFDVFVFSPVKICLMLYFWMMANRFLNDFYRESRRHIFVIMNGVMLYSTVCYINEMLFGAYWEIRVVYMDETYNYKALNYYLVAINFSKQLMFLVQSLSIILAASYIAMSRDDKSTTIRETGYLQHEDFVESWINP